MKTDKHSEHALFFRFGNLEAGAFGIPAIVVLALVTLIAGAVVFWR